MIVSPSLLAADPLHFEREIKDAEAGGADWHHIDVMDGHFVPNLSFGLPVIRSIKKIATVPLDVHIMVSNPDAVALDYVDAGADYLTFHVEAVVHGHRLAQAIRSRGAKAGIAVNPGTPIESVYPLLPVCDLVLVMSVNPGFGGQEFISETPARIQVLRAELERLGLEEKVVIEVDGGINESTGKAVAVAGAKAVVAGSYVFGKDDRAGAIASLR